jgi:hypothetical protein
MSDEMVMIGKNGPRFQTPIKIAANGKQAAMKHTQSNLLAKVMLFQVGANREEIRATRAQAMFRGMRPWRLSVAGHRKQRSWTDLSGKLVRIWSAAANEVRRRYEFHERSEMTESAVELSRLLFTPDNCLDGVLQ